MVETLAMGRFYTHARPNNFHYQGIHYQDAHSKYSPKHQSLPHYPPALAFF